MDSGRLVWLSALLQMRAELDARCALNQTTQCRGVCYFPAGSPRFGADLREGLTIRIEPFHTPGDLWLDRMLLRPLRAPATRRALDIGLREKA